MEIKRVDPYLVEWSVDGAVAIACDTGGIQLLVPDAVELLKGDIQWRRMRSPDLAGRVLAMKWSPTGYSSYYECVLACVLDTGDAIILENTSGQTEPWSLRQIDGAHSACGWSGSDLLLGDDNGCLQALRGPQLHLAWKSPVPSPSRIVELSSSSSHAYIVLADNSVWAYEIGRSKWEPLVEASRFRVFGIQVSPSGPVIARSDVILAFTTKSRTVTPLAHYVPGHLLVRQEDWAVVHTDGRVSQDPQKSASALKLPEIKGRVFGATVHPYLPIGLLVLGPVTTDWEYPIVSWQWAKTAFFISPGPAKLPRISQIAAQMYWMMLLVSEKEPPALNGLADYKEPSSQLGLREALQSLFTSDWFDAQRLRWYLSAPEERNSIVALMRSQIARLVCVEPQESDLDRAISRWYSAYLTSTEGAPKAEEEDLLVLDVKGDFVHESFLVEPEQKDTVVSQSGHVWKRCSLTLAPLLSLSSRVSLDHEFSSYKVAPGEGAIAAAILGAAPFCVFSGTQWERPRF